MTKQKHLHNINALFFAGIYESCMININNYHCHNHETVKELDRFSIRSRTGCATVYSFEFDFKMPLYRGPLNTGSEIKLLMLEQRV
jgi:hypothetical protein